MSCDILCVTADCLSYLYTNITSTLVVMTTYYIVMTTNYVRNRAV